MAPAVTFPSVPFASCSGHSAAPWWTSSACLWSASAGSNKSLSPPPSLRPRRSLTCTRSTTGGSRERKPWREALNAPRNTPPAFPSKTNERTGGDTGRHWRWLNPKLKLAVHKKTGFLLNPLAYVDGCFLWKYRYVSSVTSLWRKGAGEGLVGVCCADDVCNI